MIDRLFDTNTETDRRSFLRIGVNQLAAGSMIFGWSMGEGSRATAEDGTGRTVVESLSQPYQRGKARACVLVWLGGGPSQMETWDPKPGTSNGGPTQTIKTNAGFQIADSFPEIAKEARDISLIRSMTSSEADHGRASYYLHTGYRQIGAMTHPSLGSIISMELGKEDSELPHFVSIGGNSYGPGYLGVRHGAFQVQNPARPVPYMQYPKNVDKVRFRSRMRLLGTLDQSYLRNKEGEFLSGHRNVRKKAVTLLDSPAAKVFDIRGEPDEVKARFGQGGFGLQALMASRLVESGVPFIEIRHGGWDTHTNNFAAVANRASTLDPGVSGLIRELRSKGLLDTTLIVVAGEFGRTPRINRNVGRDHFSRCFSVLMAGGGVNGGAIIGQSSKDGMEVKDDPVSVADLYSTILSMMRINPQKEFRTAIGRSMKLTDTGNPLTKAFL